MSEQEPNTIYDPEQRGNWIGPPGQPAIPWDIGGTNEDGTLRPGTMFLEDGPLTYPEPVVEVVRGDEVSHNPAVEDIAKTLSPEESSEL
jgi:hypothetical protein